MPDSTSPDHDVHQLYSALLAAWNRRSAHDMAMLCTDDVTMIGFDGSQMEGRQDVERTLGGIFADHPTGSYVSKVRGVRLVRPDVGLLRAVAGMVPRGQTDLNPNVNAIQSLIAVRVLTKWLVAREALRASQSA